MDKEKNKEDEIELIFEDDEVEDQDAEDEEAEPAEAAQEDDAEDESDAGDKAQFGKRAQKRIRSLVQKRRELEGALQKERERANRLESEFTQQSGKVTETQEFAIKEYENRLDAESSSLEHEWGEAYESDDKSKLFELQKRISQVEAARLQLEDHKRRNKPIAKPDGTHQPVPQSPDRNVAQQQRQVDPKALRWATKNKSWFGTDDELTMDALDIHKELVVNEGVDPSTDEYYNELDKRLFDLHPKLRKRNLAKPNVAGVSRNSANGPKKFKITAEEKARADRMGYSLERFAREKAKLLANKSD